MSDKDNLGIQIDCGGVEILHVPTCEEDLKDAKKKKPGKVTTCGGVSIEPTPLKKEEKQKKK